MFQSGSSFVDPSVRGGESRTPNPMGAPFADRLAGTPLASARAANATSPRARGEGTGRDDGRDAMMAYGGTTPLDARGAVGVERGLASRDGDASRAAPKFSSLLFSSPGSNREAAPTPGGGLYRTESLTGGASTPRTSGGSNRYFGGGGPTSANRGKTEERPAPAPAPVVGGVSSRGTPLFTRTETGGDDNTPGFLRRAIEKTHAENTASGDATGGDDAVRAWLGARAPEAEDRAAAANAALTTGTSLSDSEAEHWVTVYGFSKDERAIVLREFQRDGDIVNFGAFDERSNAVNWLHVRFATKESARRARRRNGQSVNGIMIGVKELDAESKRDVGSGAAGEGRLSRNASVRRVAPTRDGISLQPRQRTTWDKVVQFVLGA